MSKRFGFIASALSACVLLGAVVAASAPGATAGSRRSPSGDGGQQPRITNGRVSPQAAGAGLAATFRSLVGAQTDVVWIGYSVPVADRERTMCCFSSENGTTWMSGTFSRSDAPCCGACRIEPATDTAAAARPSTPTAGGAAAPVKLEGADRMVIMFRVADRQVERIRTFSEDCELDAGGRPVHWLQDVRPAESVALLESLIAPDAERKNRVSNGALGAIAMHAEPTAAAALERLARSHGSSSIRGEALFWIGNRSDANAERLILDVLERDASPDVRKRAIFALSQIKNDGGVPALIRAARTHQDTAVRSEAIFWLGQKAGRKAAGTITEAIEKDPDTEVKKRAVFALSQLPKSEGVPLLIDVARKNQNPVVRKQAIFWLGQSRDPRALDFFAEILK